MVGFLVSKVNGLINDIISWFKECGMGIGGVGVGGVGGFMGLNILVGDVVIINKDIKLGIVFGYGNIFVGIGKSGYVVVKDIIVEVFKFVGVDEKIMVIKVVLEFSFNLNVKVGISNVLGFY